MITKLRNLLSKVLIKAIAFINTDNNLLKKGGLQYFKDHVMDPKFDYKKYLSEKHPYLTSWGLNYNNVESRYYEALNEIKSDLYLPAVFYYNIFLSFLNRYSFRLAYQDKNMIHKILGYKEGVSNFKLAKLIVYNTNGFFYDSDNNPISLDEAVEILLHYHGDLIFKPTVDTTWGRGIQKIVGGGITKDVIMDLINTQQSNFNFQEVIEQHRDIKSFNPTSLNTTRISTYRHIDGSIRLLYAFQRFGAKGSVVDNSSAGGGFVALNDKGVVSNRKIVHFKSLQQEVLSDNIVSQIPYFDKMVACAIDLHKQLPYFCLVGWDFTVTDDGVPCLIEFNTQPSIEGVQLTQGPVWTKKELDDLMPEIIKWKSVSRCNISVIYPNKEGYGTENIIVR